MHSKSSGCTMESLPRPLKNILLDLVFQSTVGKRKHCTQWKMRKKGMVSALAWGHRVKEPWELCGVWSHALEIRICYKPTCWSLGKQWLGAWLWDERPRWGPIHVSQGPQGLPRHNLPESCFCQLLKHENIHNYLIKYSKINDIILIYLLGHHHFMRWGQILF